MVGGRWLRWAYQVKSAETLVRGEKEGKEEGGGGGGEAGK